MYEYVEVCVLDLPKNTNSDKAQYFTKLGKLLFHSLIFIKFAISLNAKIWQN